MYWKREENGWIQGANVRVVMRNTLAHDLDNNEHHRFFTYVLYYVRIF